MSEERFKLNSKCFVMTAAGGSLTFKTPCNEVNVIQEKGLMKISQIEKKKY